MNNRITTTKKKSPAEQLAQPQCAGDKVKPHKKLHFSKNNVIIPMHFLFLLYFMEPHLRQVPCENRKSPVKCHNDYVQNLSHSKSKKHSADGFCFADFLLIIKSLSLMVFFFLCFHALHFN